MGQLRRSTGVVFLLLCLSYVSAHYKAGDIVTLQKADQAYQNPHEEETSGKWEILKVLGTGQVSAYLAKRPMAEEEVELKDVTNIELPLEDDPEVRVLKWVARLQLVTGAQEVHIAKKFVSSEEDVQNPYVVTVCGAYFSMFQYAMVYKYGGKPLNKYYPELAANRAMRHEVEQKLLEGLKYISSKRVLHRDLKPDNLLLRVRDNGDGTKSYDPMFIDFGMSEDYDSHSILLDKKVGSSRLNLPEWRSGHTYVMPLWSFDMFKLGLVFSEMLLGYETGAKLDPPIALKSVADLEELMKKDVFSNPKENSAGAMDLDAYEEWSIIRTRMLAEVPSARMSPIEMREMIGNKYFRTIMEDLERYPKSRQYDWDTAEEEGKEPAQKAVSYMTAAISKDPETLTAEEKELLVARAVMQYTEPREVTTVLSSCGQWIDTPTAPFTLSLDVLDAVNACGLCITNQWLKMDTVSPIATALTFPRWRIDQLVETVVRGSGSETEFNYIQYMGDLREEILFYLLKVTCKPK